MHVDDADGFSLYDAKNNINKEKSDSFLREIKSLRFKYSVVYIISFRSTAKLVKIFKVAFCDFILHNSCVKSKIWKNCFMSR